MPHPVVPLSLGRALLFTLLGCIPPAFGTCPLVPDLVDRFLASHADQGRVDYGALWSEPQPIDDLLATFASCPIPAAPDMATAHWINAYNMLAISGVVHHGPVASVREIPGFFDGLPFLVAGEYLTLDQIEGRALEASGMDPRVHFALVCASQGCPPLGDRAWRGDDLSGGFQRATNRAIDHLVRVDAGVAVISELFRWYADDFTPEGPRHFIQRQVGAARIDKWEYESYDWSLNGLVDLGRSSAGALLPPHAWEVRIFHGSYSQTRYFDDQGTSRDAGGRSTYRTTTLDAWRGSASRWNLGVEVVIKAVRDETGPGPPRSRMGAARLTPQIKWAWSNSAPVLRASVAFGLLDDPEGHAADIPYLDAAGPEVAVDVLWDRWWGERWNVYSEAGSRLRIPGDGQAPVLRTPLRLIPQYLAHRHVTIYTPLSVDPRWSSSGLGGYSVQVGVGAKFRLRTWFEMEAILSRFPLGKSAGNGTSADAGLRIRY